MAKKPPVHVVARKDGWAVVREGNDRATSVHQTQVEAGREGRDIARRNETGFMLHGKDGRIREHNDYGSGQRPQEGLPTGQAMKNYAPGTHALGESTTDEKGQTVQRTMDEQGDVVESAFDTEGNVVGESPAGSVDDLPEAEDYEEITDEEGITKRIVEDESGTLIEVQIGPDGRVLDLQIPPSTEKIEETTQQVGQAAQGAQDGAGRVADQAQAPTGQAAGQAQDDAGGATRQERDTAGQATDQADQAAQGAAGQQAQDAAGQVTDQDQGSAGQAAGQDAPEGQATAARATRQGNGDSQQNGEQAGGQEPNATPAAKRKAEELGADLSRTEGTGSGGRVTVKDVTSTTEEAQERVTGRDQRQGEEQGAEEQGWEAEGGAGNAVGQATGQAVQGAQDAAGQATEQVQDTARRVTDQAQGVVGGLAGGDRQDDGEGQEGSREASGQGTDRAGQAAQDTDGQNADQAQDATGQAADRAQNDNAGRATEQAQDRSGRGADQDQSPAGKSAGQASSGGQDTDEQSARRVTGSRRQDWERAERQEPNATPAAKRKAEEMDVDLYQTEGTGSDGRITAKDVTTMAGGAQERAASGTPQQGEERQAEEKDQEAEGDVQDAVSQTAGQAAQGLQDTTGQVSAHAQDLVGGLAGENQQGEGEDRGDSKETAYQAAEQPRQAARGMQDTARQSVGRVRDTVGGAPDGATQQARDVIGQDTRRDDQEPGRGGGQQQAGDGQEPDDTDAAKRKAEEKGVDLAWVEGSGAQEQITDDVTDHSELAKGGVAGEQRAVGRAEQAAQGERGAAGRTEEASQAGRRAEDTVVGSTFGDAERSAGRTRRTATDGRIDGVRHGGISDDRVNNEEEVRGMTDKGRDDDSFETIAKGYAGYEVRDRHGESLGKVEQLFLDKDDRLEYIGVGFPGGRAVLIPFDVIRDEGRRRMVVSRSKSLVGRGPTVGDDEEATPGLEERVRSHYGLPIRPGIEDRSGHDALLTEGQAETEDEVSAAANSGIRVGDTESGEFREHDPGDEGVGQSGGSDLEDEDELRVQRSEEELRAGTREREAGSVNVRKTVRTDRERIEVPIRREEVTVERVPTSGESTGIQIGEDEVSVPVVEEEVVVEKRPVVKEEVRVRKGVVEDTETVEEDVRREEVEVDDRTKRRTR